MRPVKKKPTGKFRSMLVAHIPGCTARKAYDMQVDGSYQFEVKVRSRKGRLALPKPWARFYRVDLGRMATRCAIYEARGSAQTCAIPQQTVELGLSSLIAPSATGLKPQYAVFRLGALVFEGPPKSPECINLLYGS
jgi:hypothetical protein